MVRTPMRVIISALMVLAFLWTAWYACFAPALKFGGLVEFAQEACRSEPACQNVTFRTTIDWLNVGRAVTFHVSSRGNDKAVRSLKATVGQRFGSGVTVAVKSESVSSQGGKQR